MKFKSLIFAIFVLNLMILTPVSATNTFQYALTESDVPTGFTLLTNNGNTINSSQSWNTPTGTTFLNVTDYGSSSAADQQMNSYSIFSTNIAFKGADKSYNFSFILVIYFAKKGNYIVEVFSLDSVFTDQKTLMEAQLAILPGSSSHKAFPGFTLPLVLLSFGILGLVVAKKRKLV